MLVHKQIAASMKGMTRAKVNHEKKLEKPALLDKHLSKTWITGIETVANIHFIPKWFSCIKFPYPTLLNSSALPIVTISHQILLILI